MSGREKDTVDSGLPEGFVSRWSRLKRSSESAPPSVAVHPEESEPPGAREEPLTDADMPPLESLDETSDYSGFLSEQVSEALRRQALQKLFHLEAFNVCDGLDDYADDFTSFAKLGDIITADMRHQLAMAEERLKAALDSEPAAPATADPEGREERLADDRDDTTSARGGAPVSPGGEGRSDPGEEGGTAS